MNIYDKLLKIQKEIEAIKKEQDNPYFRSKYFDINALLAVVKPALNREGLLLIQALTNVDGKLGLETRIIDTEANDLGETKEVGFVCPITETVDPQKAGSAITYFRRYAIQSLLALEAEDDDANSASDKSIKGGGIVRPKKDKSSLSEEEPF